MENSPEDEDFAEMICKSCTNRLPFLWYYYKSYESKSNIANNSRVSNRLSHLLENCEIDDKIDISNESKSESKDAEKEKPSVSCESDSGVETSCDSIEGSGKSRECKFAQLKSAIGDQPPEQLMPTYWPLEWRKNLCVCKTCVQLYADNKCLFLTDERDSVHYYESQSRQTNTNISDYEKGLSELNKMNRIQQIEYINGRLPFHITGLTLFSFIF